jgi:hypothetical protein
VEKTNGSYRKCEGGLGAEPKIRNSRIESANARPFYARPTFYPFESERTAEK